MVADLSLCKKINEIIDTEPWIKQNLDFIYDTIKANNYEIECLFNDFENEEIKKVITDWDKIYKYIIDFCDKEITREKVIAWFRYFINGCGIGIVCNKLVEKYKDARWSKEKNLNYYKKNYSDRPRCLFGISKKIISELKSALVFYFDLKDIESEQLYTLYIISSDYMDIDTSNVLDIKINFILVKNKDSLSANSPEIKFKDFSFAWFIDQALDLKLKKS